MSTESIRERTQRVIRTDRLALLREYADDKLSYCFFASFYEIVYSAYCHQLPPRIAQAIEEWSAYTKSKDASPGMVKPQDTLLLLVELANRFGLTIEHIIGIPGVIEKLKPASNSTTENSTSDIPTNATPETKKMVHFAAHAESCTESTTSAKRIETLTKEGWFVAVAITFASKAAPSAHNVLEQIPLQFISDARVELPEPYFLLLLKAM